MARLAVVGNVARDVVDGGAPSPGGCPQFAAAALRHLGHHGQIVTRFAPADAALFTGLDARITRLEAASTSGFAMDYVGDEREMTVTGLGEAWGPEDADALAPDIAWVHVAPLLRSDFPAETLPRSHAAGGSRSTDRGSSASLARSSPGGRRLRPGRPRARHHTQALRARGADRRRRPVRPGGGRAARRPRGAADARLARGGRLRRWARDAGRGRHPGRGRARDRGRRHVHGRLRGRPG